MSNPTARRLALSPSRAADFKTCPLLYRFRAIDRLAEPPTRPAARGTLVHAVLEQLFAGAPAARTEQAAVESAAAVWQRLAVDDPQLADLVQPESADAWLAECAALLRAYFRLEDPTGFSPEACELAVEVALSDGGLEIPLKGFVDRLDVGPGGELCIVDYKTGRSPSERYEVGALYQLKFYALMLYRLRGVLPAQLKLLYLADAICLTYQPDERELLAFERGVVALWRAITSAVESGEFPPSRSGACNRCCHQALCPEFGGTPPPLPSAGVLATAG